VPLPSQQQQKARLWLTRGQLQRWHPSLKKQWDIKIAKHPMDINYQQKKIDVQQEKETDYEQMKVL
jgi:hypothetical protein